MTNLWTSRTRGPAAWLVGLMSVVALPALAERTRVDESRSIEPGGFVHIKVVCGDSSSRSTATTHSSTCNCRGAREADGVMRRT